MTRLTRRLIPAAACALAVSGRCFAALKQADVFRSISENVNNDDGSDSHALPVFLLIGAGLIMFVILVSLRSNRKAVPKALNHQGKLLKELAKRLAIRPAELKQLRLLADAHGQMPPVVREAEDDGGDAEEEEAVSRPEAGGGGAIENPLVFILCPSLLMRTMQAKPAKVDKKIMAGLARRMGLLKR